MRTKKANSELIYPDEMGVDMALITAQNEALRQYLAKSSVEDMLDDKQRGLYSFIRTTMMENLTTKTRKGLVFACLIERIARTAVLLDKIERYILVGNRATNKETFDLNNKEYTKITQEHRHCIETYENLRWALENKRNTKLVEKMREVSMDWDEEVSGEKPS